MYLSPSRFHLFLSLHFCLHPFISLFLSLSLSLSLLSAPAHLVDQPQELPLPITETQLPSDLFSVLFKCQDHPQPWQALLAHAIPLQHSLLPLLAASYKVNQ